MVMQNANQCDAVIALRDGVAEKVAGVQRDSVAKPDRIDERLCACNNRRQIEHAQRKIGAGLRDCAHKSAVAAAHIKQALVTVKPISRDRFTRDHCL